MKYAVFASYGNDSIALIQWLREKQRVGGVGHLQIDDVCVVYSDTKWSRPDWASRVEAGEAFAQRCGFATHRLASEGLVQLVRRKKGWPRQGLQFCTQNLKIDPAKHWLDKVDSDGDVVCMVGVRRSESRARSQFPEWTEESEYHGGRSLWAPLVRHTDEQRDELIRRAGFDVLPHRSMECWPCINSNRSDLRTLTEESWKSKLSKKTWDLRPWASRAQCSAPIATAAPLGSAR